MKTEEILRAAAFLLVLGGIAAADEVRLKNGSVLEGTVKEEGSRVTIDLGSGVLTLDRSDIESISRPNETVQAYDRRLEGLSPDDLDGKVQLALWARLHGLQSRSERLLRSVLELNPNHEGARTALGYVNYKGAWLTPDEHKAALGLVRYGGEWMSADAAARMRKIDQELALGRQREAGEQERRMEELQLERARLGAQERVTQWLQEQGQYQDMINIVTRPGAMRYWGPANPAPPLPNAD